MSSKKANEWVEGTLTEADFWWEADETKPLSIFDAAMEVFEEVEHEATQ